MFHFTIDPERLQRKINNNIAEHGTRRREKKDIKNHKQSSMQVRAIIDLSNPGPRVLGEGYREGRAKPTAPHDLTRRLGQRLGESYIGFHIRFSFVLFFVLLMFFVILVINTILPLLSTLSHPHSPGNSLHSYHYSRGYTVYLFTSGSCDLR